MRETADQSHLGDPTRVSSAPGDLALVICGRHSPISIPLPEGADLQVGRSNSCRLVLNNLSVSRTHARFYRQEGRVYVEDLGSRHGTWVHGRRVERAEISLGSSVHIADVIIVLTRRPGASASMPVQPPQEALYLSPRMREVRDHLRRAALTELPVLVLGETGTGKALAAREIHAWSARARGPLRTLNCAAVPPHLIESTLFGHEPGAFAGAERARAGAFEEAQGGTLFLDEVGELSLEAQAAVLRALDSQRMRRVGSSSDVALDVRVVAATQRDVNAMAARGEFRLDLLHRLCVIAVELPPLRQRPDEVAALAQHFLAQAGVMRRITSEALALLEQYEWPGNLRELRNALARAAALGKGLTVDVADLPEAIVRASRASQRNEPECTSAAQTSETDLRSQLRALERAEVMRALEQSGGNQRKAAALLGIPLRTFERRLQRIREHQA